jgi:NodT family efflux transporter outer membrane factor (OMF) lipoprotein
MAYLVTMPAGKRCLALALGAALCLQACATFTPPVRGPETVALPADYQLYGPTMETPDRWWEAFETPALNALVDEAIAGNLTLRQSAARLTQAVAVAQQNRAALFPQVGYSGGTDARLNHQDAGFGGVPGPSAAQRIEALSTLIAPGTGSSATQILSDAERRLAALQTVLTEDPKNNQTVTTKSYGLGLTANYEVDLWGRLGALSEASLLDVTATQEDLFAAMQTVAGQVALTWLDLLQVRQTLRITQSQLETNRTTLELIELRFRKGLATALDVFQQRQAVAQTEAVIPPLEAQAQVLLHSLAVLLGKEPRAALDLGNEIFPEPRPLPEYGLPADLLARRPDVRATGLRLYAADWRVSAAQADRLPALQLSGGFGVDGDGINTVFDNWLTTLAASVTGPIFDAGQRDAAVMRTRAVVDERLNDYRLTVLTAVAEVENALVRIDRQQAFIVALRTQYETAESTHREALNRYRKGLSDYLPVLTALTNAQGLERDVIEAEHDLLVFRVQLHLALGGDWMRTAADAPEEISHD